MNDIPDWMLRALVWAALSATVFIGGHLIYTAVTLEWATPLASKESRLWAVVATFIVIRAQFVKGDA